MYDTPRSLAFICSNLTECSTLFLTIIMKYIYESDRCSKQQIDGSDRIN